jgi:hypothetical protein
MSFHGRDQRCPVGMAQVREHDIERIELVEIPCRPFVGKGRRTGAIPSLRPSSVPSRQVIAGQALGRPAVSGGRLYNSQ